MVNFISWSYEMYLYVYYICIRRMKDKNEEITLEDCFQMAKC